MLLHGKGLWAYREAELTQALQMAPQMHITHILYKVGQGPCAGNPGFYLTPDTKAAQIAQTIRQAGMIPLAWSFTTLGDPTFEADMVVRAFNDGYDGFIFNMEDDCSGRFVAATQLTQRLQNLGVDSSKLYLCSYPTPLTHHPDLPYNQMGPLCQGGLMPMAYGTYLLPPDVVIDEWTYQQQRLWMQKQGLALPIYPVLGFYKGDPPSAPEDWFTKAEVQLWLNQLAPHQPTFFSVFTAAVIKSDYYAPIRAFSLGDPSGLTGRLWVPGLSGLPIHTTAGVNGSQTRARSYRDQLMGNGVATTAPDGTRWVSISDSDGSGWVPENAVAPHDPGPWPALDAPPTPPPGHLLTVWSTTELNVRSAPAVRPDTLVGRIPDQTRLTILQDTQQAQSWIGQLGKWLRVRIDPNGPEVWVAAWYVTDRDPQAPSVPSLQVKVISPTVGYLNIRKGPATTHPVAGRAQDGEILDALEPAADVERKVGQTGKWLEVRTAGGVTGYAAAWYLQLHTGAAPEIPGPTELHYVQVNSPGIGLNIRSGPGVEHTQTWWVPHTTILRSLEAPVTTAAKVGQQGQWLRIRTPGRKEGYVAAWYLEAPPAPDNRQPVSDSTLPYGSSAWIFGIHAVTVGDDAHTRDEIRALYQGKAVKGWIFFTEAVGATPQAIQPNEAIRQRLWDWAHNAGYGVIVRLNHSYEPHGTLPHSSQYAGFAAACARWAELFLKRTDVAASKYRWVIQIGNEQNNPREHPGGADHPHEHITPELYAQAFNQAYSAIKAVLPNALIAPGAIDPYNAAFLPLLGNRRYKPLDYYKTMLSNIQALDAIILHAYTHGPSVAAITHLETFGDPFLSDHYFDFQTYRLFIEQLPAHWKDVPVLITESNHICRPPSAPLCNNPQDHGWINANTGWVREAYAEINRWNNTPYAQQVQALLLYRWMGDAWTLRDKPHLLADFKQALDNDYRWRA